VLRHFGPVIAILSDVLRITIDETTTLVTLKLEGRIAGPWVAEFDRTWRSLAPSLKSKKLSLDLRDVTRVDTEGRQLLAEIWDKTQADIQTSSLLMEFYAQEAMQKNPKNGKEDTK
jgi:ABC-type transporter Mla MlaB component